MNRRPIYNRSLYIGAICEVSKAYNSETGCRDLIDEVADCEAEVLKLHSDGSADIFIRKIGETNVPGSRLKLVHS